MYYKQWIVAIVTEKTSWELVVLVKLKYSKYLQAVGLTHNKSKDSHTWAKPRTEM